MIVVASLSLSLYVYVYVCVCVEEVDKQETMWLTSGECRLSYWCVLPPSFHCFFVDF